MKPRNFPGRKLARQMDARWRAGIPYPKDYQHPVKDIRLKVGKKNR